MSAAAEVANTDTTNRLGRAFRGSTDGIVATQAMLHLVDDIRQGNYLMALGSGSVAIWAMSDLVGGQVLQKDFFQTDKSFAESPTLILDTANCLLTMMDYLNGLLPPDEGQIFGAGARHFDTAVATLGNAQPGPVWKGTTSKVYAEQHQQLISLTQEMAEVDRAMQAVLRTEAGQIKDAHLFHRALTYAVTLATPIALTLYRIPMVGPAASTDFQRRVAGYALSLAADRVIAMADRSGENAASVRTLSQRYHQVLMSAGAVATAVADARHCTAPQPVTAAI